MIEVIDCAQNSDAWLRARMGIPTSSMFATVMASGKGGGPSLTRAAYMKKLAGEIICGEPMENYTNSDMERGHAMEEEARDFYAFTHNAEPECVGFIRNGQKGGSPDALVGTAGLLEIKTARPHILIEYMMADKFPPEHMAQCQGNIWVSEREWLDICIFWPKMPKFVKRITRDEDFLAKLASAVDQFNDELSMLVERIRRYGQPPEARMERVRDSLMASVP